MKNAYNKARVFICGFLIAAFAVAMPILPDNTFSEKENRRLAKKPVFTLENLFSGKYTDALSEYYADQFPLRDLFVAGKAYCELGMGKRENNGIVYGKNGVLIPVPEIKENRLYENLSIISELGKRTNSDITLAALPRTADVFSEYLPASFSQEELRKIWEELAADTNNLKLKSVDLYSKLCEDNLYYKTDHHYTSDGAYSVYSLLGDALGYTPENKDYFKIETVSKDFCGTSMRTSGFYLCKKDSIKLYRYENDMSYSVVADGKEIALYDFSKLETTDKYAVFLGGNHARVDITANAEGREKLLLIRDSFADSIIPFLAIHYDITLIDLRYYQKSVAEILREENIGKALVYESIGELAAAKNLSYLKMN